jgi:predicted O-methyltransferase YrrM
LPGRLAKTLQDLPHRHPRLRQIQHRFGLLPTPRLNARQWERSLISSADDQPAPSDRLLDIAAGAVAAARTIPLDQLRERIDGPPWWPEIWPGEHYRLLAGLVEHMAPRVVIEIGTATGLSALALAARLPAGGQVATFDIVPWREYPGAVLRDSDFDDGTLVQHIADLSDPAQFERHRPLLEQADLVFIDAKKDGDQERSFLKAFGSLDPRPLMVFDDIRQWDMLAFWRGIDQPKLDLTSFGHWSGTGLV